jgi:hypothetical protein
VEKIKQSKNRKWQKEKFPPLEHDKILKGWKNSDQIKTENGKTKFSTP